MKKYRITYCHMLRADKTMNDFATWINTQWDNQKIWSAHSVTIWQEKTKDQTKIFYSYKVSDLKEWSRIMSYKSAAKRLECLNEIVNLDHISIKINPVDG